MKTSLFWHLNAFLIGIISAEMFSISISLTLVLSLFILALLFSSYSYIKFFLLLLAFFSLAHYRVSSIMVPGVSLEPYFKETKIWSFWVCDDPEPDWDKQVVIACPLSSAWPEITWSEKIILNLSLYPSLSYGDIIDVRCRLDQPPSFSDFNYSAYLQAKGIGAVCSWPQIISWERDMEGDKIFKYLFNFKRRARFLINKSLPEPHSGLASSLLLAYRKTLYPEELELVRRAGLNHIIVISGAHISLFVLIFVNAFIYLGLNRNKAIFPTLIIIFLYVAMIGFPASAWRSLIMGSLLIYAWWRGSIQNIWISLLLAAAIMLYQKPLLWRYDLGFQLSFAALAGIISWQSLIFNFLKKAFFLNFYSWTRLIAQALALSLSAQLAIWPILVGQIGGVALFSPLSNVLAFIIFIPLIISLLIALALSLLSVSWIWLWWPAYVLIEYFLKVCRLVSNLPGAYLDINNFNSNYIWPYYLCLFLLARYLNRKNKKKNFIKMRDKLK